MVRWAMSRTRWGTNVGKWNAPSPTFRWLKRVFMLRKEGTSVRASRNFRDKCPNWSRCFFMGGMHSNRYNTNGARTWFKTLKRAYMGSGRRWNCEKTSWTESITESYILSGVSSAVMGCPRWVTAVVEVRVVGGSGGGINALDTWGAGCLPSGRGWYTQAIDSDAVEGTLMTMGALVPTVSTSVFSTFNSMPILCRVLRDSWMNATESDVESVTAATSSTNAMGCQWERHLRAIS